MSLKEYSISVKTTGYEYYTVEAHTEEEAIKLVKNGDGYLQSSESGWDSDFVVDDVVELEGEEY